MKKLKIYNGRGWGGRRYDKDGKFIPDPTGIKYCDHAYVCAYSRAHVVRLINQARGLSDQTTVNELKVYWSEGHWGDAMKGIEPEIGVWTQQNWIVDKKNPIMRIL